MSCPGMSGEAEVEPRTLAEDRAERPPAQEGGLRGGVVGSKTATPGRRLPGLWPWYEPQSRT